MSAFVEAKPLPRPVGDVGDPVPVHVLLPRIEADEYLAFSFEERLTYELESAGLGRPAGFPEDGSTGDMFRGHLDEHRKEMEKQQPNIDRIKDEILGSIEQWVADQKRRREEQRKALALMQEVKKRGGHK
jgi:hypothetical protein